MSEKLETVTQYCLEFSDVDAKVGVNLVRFENGHFVPRVGEKLMLPGEDGAGRGYYEVVSVAYMYFEVEKEYIQHPAEARLHKVMVAVKKVRTL